LKSYEKSFLIRNFLIFFFLLELLLAVIFYFIYLGNENSLKKRLFFKMYNCSWTLKCEEFEYEIVSKKKYKFGLEEDRDYFYAYFNIPNSEKYSLKVIYSYEKYKKDHKEFFSKILIYFLLSTTTLALITFFISYYALKPMRRAFKINEEFIKDILHDINTPLAAIVLNLSMINDKKYEKYIKRLHNSVELILSLQKNLKTFLKEIHKINWTTVDIYELLKSKVDTFKELYPEIDLILIKQDSLIIRSDKELLERIIDNLISNACKYNSHKTPFVKIELTKSGIVIEDNGRGIKDVDKIFNRYYKETQRGVGLGLNIVKKLCKELNIKISIESAVGVGTKVELKM